jgi:membrane associated rhomboid family serine protease
MSGPLSRDAAAALLGQAWELAGTGDWDQSAAAYARLVGHSDPEVHVAALLGLAEARYRLDDEPGALQAWIAATQAPDTSNSWRAWKALAAARVRENDLAGATRAYREGLRRAPPDERAEIASRLGWLTKEMGEDRTAERYFSRSRTNLLPTPRATWSILAVTIAIGVSTFLSNENRELWYGLFALDKAAVAAGQWWRLVTVVLVHADLSLVFHLLFNMYALWVIGPFAEALYGSARFVAIYALTAAAGSAASYVASPALGVGASGAIFGLFGLIFVADRVHRPALTRAARGLTSQIGMLVVLNLAIGFLIPFVDVSAHIGGLIAGAWLGFVLVPRGATLAGRWQRPPEGAPGPSETAGPSAAAPGWQPGAPSLGPAAGEPSRPVRGETVLRFAGVLALVAVIAAAVRFG